MRAIHESRGLAALIAIGLLGCDDGETAIGPPRIVFGSGNVVAETRAVSGFSGLSMEAIGDVHLSQGTGETLRIEGEDNLLALLITEVRDGVLHIRIQEGVDLRPTEEIDYYLGMTTIDGVTLAGAGGIEGTGISASDLSITLTGVGDVDLSGLTAYGVDVAIAGVGDVSLTGTAAAQTVTISGLGDYAARDLTSALATATISGSGTVAVRVSDRLVGTISGSGWICYIGLPVVQSTITGQGTIGPCAGPGPAGSDRGRYSRGT
jgi:hypothetical protein